MTLFEYTCAKLQCFAVISSGFNIITFLTSIFFNINSLHQNLFHGYDLQKINSKDNKTFFSKYLYENNKRGLFTIILCYIYFKKILQQSERKRNKAIQLAKILSRPAQQQVNCFPAIHSRRTNITGVQNFAGQP